MQTRNLTWQKKKRIKDADFETIWGYQKIEVTKQYCPSNTVIKFVLRPKKMFKKHTINKRIT